jgi:hypothetical protein
MGEVKFMSYQLSTFGDPGKVDDASFQKVVAEDMPGILPVQYLLNVRLQSFFL